MSGEVVMGLDGGGTYTRVAIADIGGNLLSYVERKGGACIHKDLLAKENVYHAVCEAVSKAGCVLGDIISLSAGVAGLDSDSDLEWARELTNIDGLDCLSRHVNDAVIAHHGAFLAKPGIIAISGTGSIVFGITESGQHIRNYDFCHYAATAARFLSYDAVYQIIAGETDQTDGELVSQVVIYFKVKDMSALAKLGSEGFTQDDKERDKQFGDFAPIVTNAALNGSHLAMKICNQAAAALVTGIKLIGSCFDSAPVSVALLGSVANSMYIKNTIYKILNQKTNQEYIMIEPVLPAVLGAIMMAMELKGIAIDEQVLNNLIKGKRAINENV